MEYGIAAIVVTVLVLGLLAFMEYWLARRRGVDAYARGELLSSIAIFGGHKLSDAAALALTFLIADQVWAHRLFTLPQNAWWSYALAFLGIEFFYYWHHRLGHEVNWLWATHSVHHSAEKFNFIVSFRLGWMPLVDGAMMSFLPLVMLGLAPHELMAVYIGNKVYQFWIHTTLIPRLRGFDAIFNSPSNHRVHHARNPAYLNKNYGGSLVVFDRLFGTYAAERADTPCDYGLVHRIASKNPLRIALNGWANIIRELGASSGSLREILQIALYPPGHIPAFAQAQARAGAGIREPRTGSALQLILEGSQVMSLGGLPPGGGASYRQRD